MSVQIGLLAICWGVMAGYLLLRGVDSLLGLLFCLHGLFQKRWKILADKNATGLIRTRLILKLAFRLGCYAVLCATLLSAGTEFLGREFRFGYAEKPGLLFAVASGGLMLSRLHISWRRMRLVWRMTHEFDFAERRERTQLLKR